jgi:hypothetical protein
MRRIHYVVIWLSVLHTTVGFITASYCVDDMVIDDEPVQEMMEVCV